jgi:two-component sensor histidine kinase
MVQPIGLLVNELVTNAAKHEKGKITVTYYGEAGMRTLRVCDRGKGLPANFNIEASRSGLGMKVVGILAKQLKGNLMASANPEGSGSCFEVSFPV